MKAEKVIITKAAPVVYQKDKTENAGWLPNEEMLPDVVKADLDKWLTHDEQIRRRKAVRKALEDMVRDGKAREKTVILPLIENKEVVDTPFTFYKIIVKPSNK